MNVYFISGLCADKTIFKYIRLPEGYKKRHLEWIPPLKNESLTNYAARLAEEIDFSSPFSVIGLSLGGMLASEISRQFSPVRTVLISSIPSYNYLPGYFKLAGSSGFYNLLPTPLFKHASVIKHFFSTESREDKKMIADMIRQSDPSFIRWAISAVLHWKSTELENPYVHIHGTRDEVFPIRYIKPSHVIKGGDHLLVMTFYNEVNKILGEVLT